MTLFPALIAQRPPGGIDLRCCGVDEVIAETRGARLVVADPPWCYAREAGAANPDTHEVYDTISEAQIVAHLDASHDCLDAGRLACWYTWPKDAEWTAAGGAGPRWGPRTSGGAWQKLDHVGVGYHWRGHSEPVALFTKGATGRSATMLGNGYCSRAGDHSEKPVDWLRAWLLAWTSPGDLVLDLYAGMAPMARACLAEGRRYIGAEIDPDRHAAAVARLHVYRSQL